LINPEIAHFFALGEDERRTVNSRCKPLNRLGVALQIGFLRLPERRSVPPSTMPSSSLKLRPEVTEKILGK
jgi:hypothetical protein